MTKKVHNKKRNVGILYDLLARKVSEGLVENDTSLTDKAIKIIEDNFTKDSVLLKEYKLFSALSKACVDSEHVASRLLEQAKKNSMEFDTGLLESEKSRLIKVINKTFDDSDFFNTKIPEYKNHATVQILLNAWRDPSRYGLEKVAEYEQKVTNLIKEKKKDVSLDDIRTEKVDALTLKIMTEKFNKKFKTLTGTQKLMTETALTGNSKNLSSLMKDELNSAKRSIKHLKETEKSEWILKKATKIEKVIESLDPQDTSEENVRKFMTLSQMTSTITSE